MQVFHFNKNYDIIIIQVLKWGDSVKKLLALFIALCVFSACESEDKATKTTETFDSEISATETSVSTEDLTVEPIIPSVVTANSIEKNAVFDGGDWTFTQSVKYPKIDSENEGAAAINKEIAERYEEIIAEIAADEESGLLYTVDYSHSVANGIIFIRIEGYTGLYGSEGYYHQKLYYYDVANDKATTPEEYASRAGVDLEKAKENILYSVDLANAYMEDTAVPLDGNLTEIVSPEKGKIYPAKQTMFDYTFDGVEVVDNEVHLYYQGQEFIYLTFDFVLDRATLLPIESHYICELPTEATETDTFKYTFENGVVTEYSLPKKCGIRSIKVTPREITIDTSRVFTDATFSINGGEKKYFGNWMTLEDGVLYTAYFDSYIAPEEIKTIEFFDFEPRIDVIPSETYTKEAIDILGGDIEYTHSVTYPIIDSTAPGATALNAKISEKYEKVITKLKTNKEENELFNISYYTSEWDGVFFIAIYEDIGWQYSEGSSDVSIYYYDIANDRELSAKEYLEYFGIDFEKATSGVLSSNEIFQSMLYDESMPNILSEEIGGKPSDEISPYSIYYSRVQNFNDSVKFIGAEVYYGEIYMYYTGRYYVNSILRVPLDKNDLTPINPHYEARVKTAAHQTTYDEECVEIIFDRKNVENVIRNSNNSIVQVDVRPDLIRLHSDTPLKGVSIAINGETISNGSSSYGDSRLFIHDFYLRDYCPISILKSVKITLSDE